MGADDAFSFDRRHAGLAELYAKPMFFVCGVVKSGTTWLQKLLDAHPEVSCSGEGHFVDRLAPFLFKSLDGYDRMMSDNSLRVFGKPSDFTFARDGDRLYLLASAVLLLLQAQPGAREAKTVGEKTPDNIRRIELLSRLFPSARFLHIVRDGRDGAISCWRHNLRLFPEPTRRRFASIDEFAVAYAESWVREVPVAAGFGEREPARLHTLRYEDLVADPATALRDAFAFLEVDADAALLRKICAAASFERLSGGRRRGQEDPQSFYRKGEPGEWREALDEPTKQQFWDKAGAWLTRFGYDRA
jgi:hypothetical protein